jgi:hypothetical protein
MLLRLEPKISLITNILTRAVLAVLQSTFMAKYVLTRYLVSRSWKDGSGQKYFWNERITIVVNYYL